MDVHDLSVWLVAAATIGALFAGFIDAVVGGGGLVQVPLLFILFPELSHVQVIASNRFASLSGTSVAAFQYGRKMKMPWKIIGITGVFTALAAYGGTFAMRSIDSATFKPMLLVILIALTIYSFIKKDLGNQHALKYKGNKLILISSLIGAMMGFYNGFIGPGTGTLLVFSFVSVLGMGFLESSAQSKVINAMADAASLIGFLLSGAVLFKLAIPMMAANMLGGFIGSRAAMLRGNQFIRYVFLFVMSVLIIRLSWDLL